MSWNIRRRSLWPWDEFPHPSRQWRWRRSKLLNFLREEAPDILCLQETTAPQMRDIRQAMPQWEGVFQGRQSPRGRQRSRRIMGTGEGVPIFWNRQWFTCLEIEHFWLSDTPETVGSRSWGNRIPRMVTAVHLQEKISGQTVWVANTHFDHQTQDIREKSVGLLLQWVTQRENEPIIVAGDFNTGHRQPAYNMLTEGALDDTWDVASAQKSEAWKTHNGWTIEPSTKGSRIDRILVSPEIVVSEVEVLTSPTHAKNPLSDHWPLKATFDIGLPHNLA